MISINSARTVTCDRPHALDDFVNAAKLHDIGQKTVKKGANCSFGIKIYLTVLEFEIVTCYMCDILSILEGL